MPYKLPAERRSEGENPWPLLIQMLREKRGCTRERLGLLLEVSANTMRAWEDGDWRPVPAAQKRILALFDQDESSAIPVTKAARTPHRGLALVTLWERTGASTRRSRCIAEGMIFDDHSVVLRYGEDMGAYVALFHDSTAVARRHPESELRERIL